MTSANQTASSGVTKRVGRHSIKLVRALWNKMTGLISDTRTKVDLVQTRFAGLRTRVRYVRRHSWSVFHRGMRWVVRSREVANFTYDITDQNKVYIAHAVSVATGEPAAHVHEYVRELAGDEDLRRFITNRIATAPFRYMADPIMDYGRRYAWYAIVRALKPRVVIETGLDKGLGSVVLCAALRRNAAEGFPGRYYGTDIAPWAGYLLAPPYSDVGEILFGDSIESLSKLSCRIDLFINDSDHSAEYEGREYVCIKDKLSEKAVILGDNAHVTTELARFSEAQGRKFIFIPEYPKGHWYPGAGVGVSFR